MLSQIFESAYVKAKPSSEGMSSSKATAADETGGFREWPILLSTRAQKDLRDVKRTDGAMFQIVMKKIK